MSVRLNHGRRASTRSTFIGTALRRALDELAEARIRRAYEARPDAEPAYFDRRVWEPRTRANSR